MQGRRKTGPGQTTSFGKAALNEEIFGILSTALIVPLQGSHRGRVMYSAAEDAPQPGTYTGGNKNISYGILSQNVIYKSIRYVESSVKRAFGDFAVVSGH
ncbi:hypothetical protein NPIL_104231 [Nephila pilipes]|uniref:Uncharacterized protein n=1 Tax=Nephila pilipes TaxID=299642 RepID=A0A8X6UKQ5_NEPPI|nr:hypothetical protein NPIL_104231 [Nephila pilipes]